MVEILRFCHENRLLLLADEVYQENVYDGKFTSFKKVGACVRALQWYSDVWHTVSTARWPQCAGSLFE